MENENIEEIIPEGTPDPVEGEESIPDTSPDILPDETDMENGEETIDDVPSDETGGDSSLLIPEEAPEEVPEETPEETLEEETGETENEDIYEMENGNEDFYGSVSDNGIMGDGTDADAPANYNVTNYYTTEVPAEEVIPLWENSISNFSTSEMLLFLIFLLLLVQFVHKIFKGSHWLKG